MKETMKKMTRKELVELMKVLADSFAQAEKFGHGTEKISQLMTEVGEAIIAK